MLYESEQRHINTSSDSEVLLNIFAHELASRGNADTADAFFDTVAAVAEKAVGAYAAEHGIAAASMLVEPQLAIQCAVINTPTLVLLQRDNQGWQLQARRSITSSRQLRTLLDAYLVQAEKVSADYRLGVRA